MKKTLSAFLACIVVACTVFVANTGASQANAALGCKTYACHEESPSLTSGKAVDGNVSSRYAAGSGCAQNTEFGIDLGAVYDITSIEINWEAAYASSSRLEISKDGKNFTLLKDIKTTSSGKQTLSNLSGTGRYLRLTEQKRALEQYGFSIFEFSVYGSKSAVQDGKDAYILKIDSASAAVISADKSGFVPSGETVTLTVAMPEGTAIESLNAGDESLADKIVNGKVSFEMKKDTTVTGAFKLPSSDRYEAEDCTILDGNGNKSGAITADAGASGGYYVGGTGGKSFIMENVKQSNRISAAYSSTNTNVMTVFISVDGGEFYLGGTLPFSTTYAWKVENQGVCYSDMIYFPEGCTVKVIPAVDVDLDWFAFSSDAVGNRDNLAADTISALDAEGDGTTTADDIMAYLGQSVTFPNVGAKLTFTAPCDGNIMNIKYNSDGACSFGVTAGDKSASSEFTSTDGLRFIASGVKVGDYKKGDKITVELKSGSNVRVDWAVFATTVAEDVVTVEKNPSKGERMTVSLDGIWGCEKAEYGMWSVEENLPIKNFTNSIPVPGLSDLASVSLGDLSASKLYYRKTVILNEEPTGNVTLEIKRAQYGRFIYVNGTLADSYEYNYSNSFSDITGYLHKGENEIVIMLGSYTRQLTDPISPAHVLVDGEKKQNLHGITDSVNLIFNSTPSVNTIKTAPDIDKGTLNAVITLQNSTKSEATTDVTVEIYELGVFKNGKAQSEKKLVATTMKSGVKVSDNITVEFDGILLDGFGEDKLWSPANPFLYSIVVKTSGDTKEVRFGMRTFNIDPQTKLPMLNGKVYYLFGTNIAINRFYEDPLRARLPWTEDWIRKLYSEFRDTNWEAFRFHLGSAPEIWYDIADEAGMLIVDEYACWGADSDGCSTKTLLPEIYRWMDERCNHPSVIVWDIQNEGMGADMLTQTAAKARSYDIQNRNWDNGFTAPQNDTDWVECHPYLLGGGFKIANLNNIPKKASISPLNIEWFSADMPNPKILNEYGSIWLDRLGDGTEGTIGTWNAWGLKTREERLTYYAEAVAAVTEFWRSTRGYIGFMTFDGLIYSKPNQTGWTGDVLMPDISTAESLQIRPYTQLLYRSVFAKLGIVIDEYKESAKRGQSIKLPVMLINDTGKKIENLPVTVKLATLEGRVLAQYTQDMSVDMLTNGKDGVSTTDFVVTVPTYCTPTKSTLVVTAEYVLDGERYFSQRKWTITGGETSDAPTEYTVTFNTDGGNEIKPQTLFDGISPNLPTPVKEGYRFLGWKNEDGNMIDYLYTVSGKNETLTATWEALPDSTSAETTNSPADTSPEEPPDNFTGPSPLFWVGAAVFVLAAAAAVFFIVKKNKKKN